LKSAIEALEGSLDVTILAPLYATNISDVPNNAKKNDVMFDLLAVEQF
jgi:hypothetical protein